MPSKTFCIMPHISLAVQNDGDVCACNLNKQSYKVDGGVYTVDKQSLSDVWDSETRQHLIRDLDNDIRSSSCKKCWDLEDAGSESPRIMFNKLFKEPTIKNQPEVLILKPGNTCNGACRICNPQTSSSWYKDAFELESRRNPSLEFPVYIKEFETIRNSFNPNNPNFWPTVKEWGSGLRLIDIYGGEPFLIKGLWDTLKHFVDTGSSNDIELQLHTNLSIWNDEYFSILTKFKSVKIGLSIDSHNKEQFEYQRHPLNFEVCLENAKKYISELSKHKNIQVTVNCTVSTLNVWDIKDIHQQLTNQLGVSVGITNLVTVPDEYYDIRHLPSAVKKQILQRLQGYKAANVISNALRQTIPNCVAYWPKFCMMTDRLDEIRNQKFSDAFPEWYSILEPYWDYKKPNPEWFR